ncbi:MAG: hypothetical protein KAU03_05140 [Candidatus Altiarchaeales archaeon]|nr:hypothetical protein [Candidatus Altiarchaeales archaeon]
MNKKKNPLLSRAVLADWGDRPYTSMITLIECNPSKVLYVEHALVENETKNYQQIMSRIVNSARC